MPLNFKERQICSGLVDNRSNIQGPLSNCVLIRREANGILLGDCRAIVRNQVRSLAYRKSQCRVPLASSKGGLRTTHSNPHKTQLLLPIFNKFNIQRRIKCHKRTRTRIRCQAQVERKPATERKWNCLCKSLELYLRKASRVAQQEEWMRCEIKLACNVQRDGDQIPRDWPGDSERTNYSAERIT